MLRASSLGLSFPPPTIVAARACRRLCGVRFGWVPQARYMNSRGSRHGDDGKSHDLESPNRMSSATTPQIFTQDPQYQRILLHHNIQLQKQVLEEEQHDAVGDPRLDTQQQSPPLALQHVGSLGEPSHVAPFSSSSTMPPQADSSKRTQKTVTTGTQMAEIDHDFQRRNASVLEQEAREPNHTFPAMHDGQYRVDTIKDAPPYPAGKPWAPEPIKPVFIPSHIDRRLESMQRAIAIARKYYFFTSKKRKGFRVTKVVELPKVSWSRLDTQKQNLRTGPSQDIVKIRLSVILDGARSESGTRLQKPPSLDVPSRIRLHLDILGTTNSTDQAWHSYVYLVDTIASHPLIYHRVKHICYSHLHRFARLLSRNRPRTRLQYLRLLSIMTYIVHCGGQLKLPEWNALIHHSAAVRRKTTIEDVENALNVFKGMRRGELPFTSAFDPPEHEDMSPPSHLSPDAFTISTLLSIAARAKDETMLYRLAAEFERSYIPQTRYAHLVMFRYYGEKRDLGGVRHTLRKMSKLGFELGLDGLNAVLWAYGINDRLDIVWMIYSVLRHNRQSEVQEDRNIRSAMSKLKEESILINDDMIPNEITYTSVIQLFSYNGHFKTAIDVFIEMLSADNTEQGAPLYPSESGEPQPGSYAPTLVVYRALFIGFQRHGIPASRVKESGTPTWTLEHLFGLFERFLTLPEHTTLPHAFLDILMGAFAKTSDHDADVMRRAWVAIDDRFGIVFAKSDGNSRLRRLQRLLFPGNDSEASRHSSQEGRV